MNVFKKLINDMKIDSSDDDEYYDDDEYEYEDEAPRSSRFKSSRDDDYEDEEPRTGLFGRRNNVQPVRKSMEVTMVKPENLGDSTNICNLLLSGKAVVLNMEDIEYSVAQRIIDFTSGAVTAMGGKLQKISKYIFIATPSHIDLSGDFQDFLSSAQLGLDSSDMRF